MEVLYGKHTCTAGREQDGRYARTQTASYPVSYTHLDVYKRQFQQVCNDFIFPIYLQSDILHEFLV